MKAVRYLLTLVVIAGLALGCSGEGEADRPDGVDPGQPGGAPPTSQGGCEGDEEKTCSVTIEQANGEKACFTGIQFCDEGEWSPCYEPGTDPRED